VTTPDTSVPDEHANVFRMCLGEEGEDSKWYDVPAAVHHLPLGSVFTLQFVAIHGHQLLLVKSLKVLDQVVSSTFIFFHLFYN
jgi:hypothetical protein